MAAAHLNASELLGKTVSFEYVRHMQLTEQTTIEFREKVFGVITAVVISIDSPLEISVGESDFYSVSDIHDFLVS